MLPLARIVWNVFDNVFLLQMGRAYQARFRDFHLAAEEEGLRAIDEWRRAQQEEWDSVVDYTTMSAAISAIAPHAPDFAFAVWLGAAGLSVCGVFIVQYLPINAFSITDEDMGILVKDGNHYIDTALLATSVASPVIMALWSSILFIVGVVDYIIEAPLGGLQYKIFALIPIGFGVITAAATLLIGAIVGKRVEARWKLTTSCLVQELIGNTDVVAD
ncbi:hypothetical protein A0H81_09604 [Grifola frondosa]|uniref:Uncharacterized protein n=1 Tax=Grifola frondosa TaxID=5627 RepID=A0A1C7M0A1_GRIFR|nr:hypothetical protein A0H81_09604 [Grifola frondosa]